MTRRLLTIPAVLLWLVAMAYVVLRASERPRDEEDGWFLLFCCLGTLATYVGWRVMVLADGSEWIWGWRK